ncbi:hypothetical protein B296_00022861 [Ensete ventricosum]|uniref:Uncharacterized protein n=1 Tax=Ensete ventricosum TaxID=4639 RepID=A0A427AWR7_ENSVE|nr:hypothetical protein B296_00022861 [Ensete ventricosum]
MECKALYIDKHKKMASAASAVIKYVEEWSRNGSLEICYYLKAISDLGSMKLGFMDVQLFLFRREHNVLLNLIAMHYCISLLEIPVSNSRHKLPVLHFLGF